MSSLPSFEYVLDSEGYPIAIAGLRNARGKFLKLDDHLSRTLWSLMEFEEKSPLSKHESKGFLDAVTDEDIKVMSFEAIVEPALHSPNLVSPSRSMGDSKREAKETQHIDPEAHSIKRLVPLTQQLAIWTSRISVHASLTKRIIALLDMISNTFVVNACKRGCVFTHRPWCCYITSGGAKKLGSAFQCLLDELLNVSPHNLIDPEMDGVVCCYLERIKCLISAQPEAKTTGTPWFPHDIESYLCGTLDEFRTLCARMGDDRVHDHVVGLFNSLLRHAYQWFCDKRQPGEVQPTYLNNVMQRGETSSADSLHDLIFHLSHLVPGDQAFAQTAKHLISQRIETLTTLAKEQNVQEAKCQTETEPRKQTKRRSRNERRKMAKRYR